MIKNLDERIHGIAMILADINKRQKDIIEKTKKRQIMEKSAISCLQKQPKYDMITRK